MFDPEREGPSDADLERFDDESATCPACGEEVYHDAAMCPACGEMLHDRSGAGLPAWAKVGLVLAGVGFVLVFVL